MHGNGGKAWERYALLCRPSDMSHVERGSAGTCEARALHGDARKHVGRTLRFLPVLRALRQPLFHGLKLLVCYLALCVPCLQDAERILCAVCARGNRVEYLDHAIVVGIPA